MELIKKPMKFRTPSEYIHWFESLLNTIDSTDRKSALRHEGNFKKNFEELFPLYILLTHKKLTWCDSRFRNVLCKQENYDVEIQNNSLNYLEITVTNYNEIELSRMNEHLEGRPANLLGRMIRDKKNRIKCIENVARRHNEIVQEEMNGIIVSIKGKSKIKYPKSTGLIVYYDDCSSQFKENDYQTLRSCVCALKNIWGRTFDVIFLVGTKPVETQCNVLIEVAK